MTISFNVARLARLSRPQSTAIAMELGVHNGTVAITVGAGIATILASPAAVYSVFMFITAGVFARVMYKRNAAEEDEGVVSERELPVESRRPAPVPVAAGSATVAVLEPEPAPAARPLPDEPEPVPQPEPAVRAHPGSGFWRVMTGAAIAFAAGSLLLTLLAIAGVG